MSVERLGRFELVSHLASGGMAKVFLARVAGLAGFERHVVLKTLRKEDIPDESYVGMFLDEARLAASLHHQHVAQVYDVGCTSDGTYFLAMEYVHGKTVRSVLETVDDRRLWIPLDFGLSVVAAAAAGLHHAHERCRSDGTPLHIVHRDVSPSNVLVSYDGSIKLIDFGIAKAIERVTQTRTGFIKGKAGYMAPEQARGYEVDRRSDVFALGVLAYELTTQHRAFDAATEFERVEKIVHGDVVPPSHWMPDYPEELESIVLTALALDPDERYQSADEMRLAIEACAKSENLILGGAPVARTLSMLYGAPLEPWIMAPPRASQVAKGSGSHDSLVFVPDIPEPVDESSDITRPLDRELTEAEAIVDELAERHAANARHVAAREARNAEQDAASTASLRALLPRAGTIKPLPPPHRAKPASVPPPLPAIISSVTPPPPADDPPFVVPTLIDDEPLPFVAQPIAPPPIPPRKTTSISSPPPLTLDEPYAVPMLIAVDTPSSPISNFAPPPPPPMVMPVTIQPRNRRSKATPTPAPKTSLRRQVLAVIACGAVLGLAIGVTITVLGNNDAPATATSASSARTAPVSSRTTPTTKPATKPAFVAKPTPIAPAPTVPAPTKSAMATAPIEEPAPTDATPSPPIAEIKAPATEVTIHVVTDPPGATVVLDGVRLGTTPFTGTVPAEKRDGWLKVRKRGLIAVKTKVDRATDIRWDVRLESAKR